MNGQPLKHKGKLAAYRRVRNGGETNFEKAQVTDEMLEVAEVIRPKLVQDGMFLVRIDMIGGKLIEINVFTPGGLEIAQQFEGANFANAVIGALERKVQYMQQENQNFLNIEMAVL